MVATMANGQPAFVAYQRAQDGTYQPHAVHVLTVDQSGVAHIAVFRESAVCTLFEREAGSRWNASAPTGRKNGSLRPQIANSGG